MIWMMLEWVVPEVLDIATCYFGIRKRQKID